MDHNLRKPRQRTLTSCAPSSTRLLFASTRATKPTTAAKDISKLGSNRLAGATSRISKAASATLRMVSAGRSRIIAKSTMLIMIQERTVGTAALDRSR
jgi:hypothetical protein